MSDGKEQEPYDSTHIWGIKQKATNEQNKQTHIHREHYEGYWGEVMWEVEMKRVEKVKDVVTDEK